MGTFLQQGGLPLATWITVILMAITLLLQVVATHPNVTPQELQQIIEQVQMPICGAFV